MADDIDIEEHDVMDNPTIKNMFPDLSILKKEIQDYYDQALELNQEPEALEHVSQITKVTSTNGTTHSMEIYQSVSLSPLEDHIGNEESSISNQNILRLPIHSNKIILGTKPPTSLNEQKDYEIQQKSYEAKVLLMDLKSYLHSSKRYCKDCHILFPEINSFETHNKAIHYSTNVDKQFVKQHINLKTTMNNKIYECKICGMLFSTSGNLRRHCSRNIHKMKISFNGLLQTTMNNKKYKCKICGIVFSTFDSWQRHCSRNIHKTKVMIDGLKQNSKTKTKFVPNTHNRNKNSDEIMSSSSNTCFHCKKIFLTQKCLIEHLYDILQSKNIVCGKCNKEFPSRDKLDKHMLMCHNNIKDKIKVSEKKLTIHENHNITKTKLKNGLYSCLICSYYFKSLKFYTLHLANKHKILKIPKLEKVTFVPKCKYCSTKNNTVAQYNVHIQQYHKKQLKQVIKRNKLKINTNFHNIHNDLKNPSKRSTKRFEKKDLDKGDMSFDETVQSHRDMPILKSTLFKCTKCDIHFLSAKTAMSHTNHSEMLINWKCAICQHIFKNNDKSLHEIQHSFSRAFTVYNLSESIFSGLMYSCSKCAIHFTEDNFTRHYSNCGLETSNSAYCNICDILVDSDSKRSHDYGHMFENLKPNDFIIIKADILDNKVKSHSKRPRKKEKTVNEIIFHSLNEIRPNDCMLSYMYCNTCKCFITKMHNDVHLQSRCTHILKYVCKSCGLVLTQASILKHKKLHEKKTNLKLQDIKFYDLISKKQICPPIPDYPVCTICEVHFVSKVAIKSHVCSEEEYLTCHICYMKLSEAAFKLHMTFHNYSIIKSEGCLDSDVLNIVYVCSNCCVSVNSYDKVVEHCQEHYSSRGIEISTVKCKFCDLKFDCDSYETHKNLHLEDKNNCSLKLIKFDVFYFKCENDSWIKHIFGSLTREQIDKILSTTIYKFESRIKMRIIQDGLPDLTMYKCDKCHNFIDPAFIYKHVEYSCFKLRKHPCSTCGLSFISSIYRMQHEKIHKRDNIDIKSYRIVLFNCEEDKAFNNAIYSPNQYVLHQCRNCNGIVDKSEIKSHKCNKDWLIKCIDCGLLLYRDNYDSHVSKHKELQSFRNGNMKVVLFGANSENINDKSFNTELVSSFVGVVLDYTFYKCTRCEICMKDIRYTLKHSCSSGASKVKCPKCGLFFFTNKFKYHTNLHESDPDFLIENIQVIPFNVTNPNESEIALKNSRNESQKVIVNDCNSENISINKVECETKNDFKDNQYSNKKENTKTALEKIPRLYKCTCGLHFLTELSLASHFECCGLSAKVSKQNCPKCDLVFTPNTLYSHLLMHHADKGNVYNFDVVEIPESKNNKIVKLYKCFKCRLHFVQYVEANKHYKFCDGNKEGKKCDNCYIIFDVSCFKVHKTDHLQCDVQFEIINVNEERGDFEDISIEHETRVTINTVFSQADVVRELSYKITKESLSKIDLNKYNNTIYRCKKCNIHYLTKETLRTHIKNGNHDLFASYQDVCHICGLNFCLPSLTKHIYVHHEQLNININDIIIDVI